MSPTAIWKLPLATPSIRPCVAYRTSCGRQRRDVKVHRPATHARVERLFPQAGYGFLKTPDDREVYFHQDCVLGADFKHLDVGTEVTFDEEMGEKGPQATTVHVVGRHRH